MKQPLPFHAADILLPKTDLSKWATIACDQFTSQQEYWDAVEAVVGDAPSALRITLPEIYLNRDPEARIAAINRTMEDYLASDLFTTYPDAMFYVERTLPDGKIRRGIVGAVDLSAYDFNKGSSSLIRATEGTVLERIPPRVAIRRDASLEMPHILLLIDDPQKTVIEPLTAEKMTALYDFGLMQGGGHLHGTLIPKALQKQICAALEQLAGESESPLLFAVGDGNHSLATAKTCYEQNPTPENRFALVEIENIHDDSLVFEPIYRLLFHVDPTAVAEEFSRYLSALNGECAPQQIEVCFGGEVRMLTCEHPVSNLPVGTVQAFLDGYLAAHPEAEVDYIHGEDVTRTLAVAENTCGFLFCGMSKEELFQTVIHDGALPRKTFSMGEAASKRYYVEARKIK